MKWKYRWLRDFNNLKWRQYKMIRLIGFFGKELIKRDLFFDTAASHTLWREMKENYHILNISSLFFLFIFPNTQNSSSTKSENERSNDTDRALDESHKTQKHLSLERFFYFEMISLFQFISLLLRSKKLFKEQFINTNL